MSTHAYIPVHLDHPTDHFGEPGWVEGLPHDHTCRCECTDCYSDSNGCICPRMLMPRNRPRQGGRPVSDPTALIAAVIEYGRLSDFSSRDIAEDVMAAIREGRRPRASSPTSPPPVPDLAATIDADTDNGWTPPSSPVRPHTGTEVAQEQTGQGESGTGAHGGSEGHVHDLRPLAAVGGQWCWLCGQRVEGDDRG